jgi:amidase
LPDFAEAAWVHAELAADGRAANLLPDVHRRVAFTARALPTKDDGLAVTGMRGLARGHRDRILATRARGRMQQQWRELVRSFDVVLCPATLAPALPHDYRSEHETRRSNKDGKERGYRSQTVWPSMATVLGLPATVASIGRGIEGLPIGIQIIGPYLEDHTTIAFAGLLEREFGGFVPPRWR